MKMLLRYDIHVGVIIMDLGKTFDYITHDLLLAKPYALFHNNTKYAFHTQSLIKSKFPNHSKFIYT